jgi:hypothetical protein
VRIGVGWSRIRLSLIADFDISDTEHSGSAANIRDGNAVT